MVVVGMVAVTKMVVEVKMLMVMMVKMVVVLMVTMVAMMVVELRVMMKMMVVMVIGLTILAAPGPGVISNCQGIDPPSLQPPDFSVKYTWDCNIIVTFTSLESFSLH
jgi:hypothetical protein